MSRVQLQSAVVACLRLSPRGRCSNGPHGAMATWDVSRVTDMSRLFSSQRSFDADISNWDVSRVKDMSGMFLGASSYNGDLSRWDVSKVKDMSGMFGGATLFKRRLCGGAWVHSKATQTRMFAGSGGSISRNVCSGACKVFTWKYWFYYETTLHYPESSKPSSVIQSPWVDRTQTICPPNPWLLGVIQGVGQKSNFLSSVSSVLSFPIGFWNFKRIWPVTGFSLFCLLFSQMQ